MLAHSDADARAAIKMLRNGGVGNRIQCLHDGREALEYIHADPQWSVSKSSLPKLILLDISLLRLSGTATLIHLKSEPQTARMSIAVLVSSAEENAHMKRYDVPADGYVFKPIQLSTFTELIIRLSSGLAAAPYCDQLPCVAEVN